MLLYTFQKCAMCLVFNSAYESFFVRKFSQLVYLLNRKRRGGILVQTASLKLCCFKICNKLDGAYNSELHIIIILKLLFIPV